MMTSSLAALMVAWSAVSPDVAPVPPVPQPTFNLGIASPIYDELNRSYNIIINGDFQNIPTQLQIRFIVRRTEIADATKFTDFANPECVQCSTSLVPAPTGQNPALTAYHRLITSVVRLVLRDRQLDPGAGQQLMQGVEAGAKLCNAIDGDSRGAGAYIWATAWFGTRQWEGFMRTNVFKPQDGLFTGFASLRTYEPAKYKYTLKTEFWSGPVRLGTFNNPDGEVWIPVPR